jgi:polyferredoxin
MVGSAEPIVGLSASATKGKSLHLRRVVCGARKGGATKLPAAGDITPTICVGAGRCVDAPSRAVVYFSRPDFPLTMAVRGAALANPRAMGVGLWNSL